MRRSRLPGRCLHTSTGSWPTMELGASIACCMTCKFDLRKRQPNLLAVSLSSSRCRKTDRLWRPPLTPMISSPPLPQFENSDFGHLPCQCRNSSMGRRCLRSARYTLHKSTSPTLLTRHRPRHGVNPIDNDSTGTEFQVPAHGRWEESERCRIQRE